MIRTVDRERRSFLAIAANFVLAAGAGLFGPVGKALAMGAGPIVQGMIRVVGSVMVNGRAAAAGTPVAPDDEIATGPHSTAVFVVGDNAFLLRENSRIKLGSTAGGMSTKPLATIHMNAGKLLSVFGPGGKRLETATVACGIRGTGMYVEADPDRTYVCTCYGEVDITAAASPDVRETVKAVHHESPRFIYAKGAQLIARAAMFNHTDEELIMLERLVHRRPAFAPTPLTTYPEAY